MTHRSIKQQQQQGHYELTSVWTTSGEFCFAAARQSGEYIERLSRGQRSATCRRLCCQRALAA